MFNREFVVIDPISFVPMVLLACVVTIVGRTHAKFPWAEKDSTQSLALLIKHSLCRRTLMETTEKLQDLTVGGGGTQVG